MPSPQETDRRLEQVYHAKDRDTLKAIYDSWSETYDADLLATGYLHTSIITGLVGRYVRRRDAAILDAGVGTGGTGAVLNLLGFSNLTGLDMSEGMLAKARQRNCYVDLRLGVLGEPLDFPDQSFDAIISTGTFTLGHAPASAFDELTRILKADGILMFTVGAVIWEEQGFKQKFDHLVLQAMLTPVETSPTYCPMPYSLSESGYKTQAHVYRRLG